MVRFLGCFYTWQDFEVFIPVGWPKKPSDGQLVPSDGFFGRRTDNKKERHDRYLMKISIVGRVGKDDAGQPGFIQTLNKKNERTINDPLVKNI